MFLKTENLGFSYNKSSVFRNVSISLGKNMITALLGANGAGKTTLLKCLTQILKADSGKIFIDGKDVQTFKKLELSKLMGYVPQENIIESVTVFDFIMLGRKPYINWKITNSDIKIVENVIYDLGLHHLSFKMLTQLSGGEAQKVSIGRALAQKPKFLLLDEPTSNLDPKNQLDVLNIIKKVSYENSISVIISVHDLNMALRFSDFFILLKDKTVYSCTNRYGINSQLIKNVYNINAKVFEIGNYKAVIPE
ncbi:MAG: ABC transporter ATP-binding protein [Victivallales bacterium]|nr:ABC transporter ATP-binding protein [Victivallales bacterium]